MSTMAQTVENVAAAARSGVGALREDDLARIAQATETYESLRPVPCTQCRYCMPCPHDLDIPRNMALFMDGHIFGERRMRQSRRQYLRMDEKARAGACVQCRECEEKCPQKIEISAVMPRIHAELGE